MKKIFSALVVFGLATSLLVGCGAKPEAKPEVEDVTPEVEVDADEEEPEVDADADAEVDADAETDGANTVTVESPDFDENGWKAVLELTFDGDTIAAAAFDYVNEAGEFKSADEDYNTMMADKAGISAADAMDELVASLLTKQNPEEVDVVTGATGTTEEFIKLAKEAIEQK